jgi:hypothetical protein
VDEEKPNEALSLEEHQARGARTARRVLTVLFTISLVGGILAYRSYSNSEQHLHAAFDRMAAEGATLNTEECVPVVLAWHRNCQAMKSLCDHAIPMAMTHCLTRDDAEVPRQKERLDYCTGFTWPQSKSKWTHDKCEAIGIGKKHGTSRDDIKACGNAFGAIENFCRHNTKGVLL